ncbi:double-cubane-cluster-containing anaerobic reductase [Abyssisolibacter fermentans]|uniref:double-cubane-cluster-containing anaerobic reductase n=1 Tax=Abyssisolibacter fermentans TaxID=1766203 RepID=UPI00082A3FE0|nr:double-cubane-cluster-containing anaerobic reductase [Abyssisolibacter fermentans]
MADYKQLWSSLDIDLEKHDQLCEVLPEFYSEVYMSQENRPEGMNYFNMVISEIHGLRIKEINEGKKDNKKVVGTFCVFVPDEIITAAGGVSVGLCAGSDFWHPDGEKIVPKNTCPLVKAAVGAYFGKTCPYFQSCDLIVGETTCDAKKKAWEIFSEEIDTHVMELPQMKREKNKQQWKEEVELFKEKMEQVTGNTITEDVLYERIKIHNKKRKVLKRLYDFRKLDNSPISGKDTLLITQIAFYDDPERFIEMTEKLCDELDERVKKGIGVYKKDAPRLLITGTPMAVPNWKMHHIIETSGAAVVAEETCTGTKYFKNLISEESKDMDGMIKNIADKYIKTNCAVFTPNTDRIDDIVSLYKEYNADGVIYYTLPFCTCYASEFRSVKEALEKEGIPVIMIETGYGLEDAGQIKTRLEAFLEMIEG